MQAILHKSPRLDDLPLWNLRRNALDGCLIEINNRIGNIHSSVINATSSELLKIRSIPEPFTDEICFNPLPDNKF